jgi:hypothetical protein
MMLLLFDKPIIGLYDYKALNVVIIGLPNPHFACHRRPSTTRPS